MRPFTWVEVDFKKRFWSRFTCAARHIWPWVQTLWTAVGYSGYVGLCVSLQVCVSCFPVTGRGRTVCDWFWRERRAGILTAGADQGCTVPYAPAPDLRGLSVRRFCSVSVSLCCCSSSYILSWKYWSKSWDLLSFTSLPTLLPTFPPTPSIFCSKRIRSLLLTQGPPHIPAATGSIKHAAAIW